MRGSAEIRSRLLAWHRLHAPVRGWEHERDPYRILVREVMSQQTQIDRVVEHHERFIERFPTIDALAAASKADVIRAWRGLGYNRRAVNLYAAARICLDRFAGSLPRKIADLRRLPGIGPYTAAAIALYAFGEREPVVDTNIRRVFTRVAPRLQAEDAMRTLLHRCRDPRRVTQAVMDLGATVCTARTPRCDACPLIAACAARLSPDAAVRERAEPFEGSRRQIRGRIVDLLRDAHRPVAAADLLARAETRDARILDALERDGLIERTDDKVRLPR